jgi:hypothetical protein
MSGVSGRVSVPQRRDAREAIYEPPDRSLWLYIWEFHGSGRFYKKSLAAFAPKGVIFIKKTFQLDSR